MSFRMNGRGKEVPPNPVALILRSDCNYHPPAPLSPPSFSELAVYFLFALASTLTTVAQPQHQEHTSASATVSRHRQREAASLRPRRSRTRATPSEKPKKVEGGGPTRPKERLSPRAQLFQRPGHTTPHFRFEPKTALLEPRRPE